MVGQTFGATTWTTGLSRVASPVSGMNSTHRLWLAPHTKWVMRAHFVQHWQWYFSFSFLPSNVCVCVCVCCVLWHTLFVLFRQRTWRRMSCINSKFVPTTWLALVVPLCPVGSWSARNGPWQCQVTNPRPLRDPKHFQFTQLWSCNLLMYSSLRTW